MAIAALDEKGSAVDWWFIYKVPKLTQDAQTDSATGYEYVYFDAKADMVVKSPNRLDQNKGALNLTLNSVFNKPPLTTGWILYNDEKPAIAPGADDSNLGHTKGVIAFDTKSETAFWLLHSWPKYAAPALPGMPTPMFGQTFLCITTDIATAGKIAAQMATHQEPQCYLPRAATLAKDDPIYALTQPLQPNPKPDANVSDCQSAGGLSFKVLAKNREWGQDFWNGFVGPELGADMDVETWIRGPIPPVADTDGIHKTFDIKFINLGPLGAHWAWPETQDHAKWGITTDADWICVGDINRMISQRKRGGGTIAFQNRTLWQALSKTDLILAPPGHNREDALKLIQSTHVDPEAPPAKKKRAAKKAPRGRTAEVLDDRTPR
jgi:deoxyribonuclease-2